jgi:prepilin-type N-terminal cleavage/methylation domain-containing protein
MKAMSMHRQNGFTMIELMVALLIGVFLLGGMTMMVEDNKRTFVNQS